MQTANHVIPIANTYLLPDFPETLNLTDTEAFTADTWKELFDKAVSKYVPKYPLAVVQLPFNSGETKRRYKMYDGLAFRNYFQDCMKKGKELRDLQTREKISEENVKYFAMNCFEKQKHQISRASPFQEIKPLFAKSMAEKKDDGASAAKPTPNRIPSERERQLSFILKFTLDGLNHHSDDRRALGESQQIVANAWSHLHDYVQADIWKWCAKHHLTPSQNGRNQS